MSRPENLKTKIFLASAEPEETKEAIETIGFLDGQVVGLAHFIKSSRIANQGFGNKQSTIADITDQYKKLLQEIGSIALSGQIVADVIVREINICDELVDQGREMHLWSVNNIVRLPMSKAGLEATQILVKDGVNINLSPCFSVKQAAAATSLTWQISLGHVSVSTFVSDLEKIGQSGTSLVESIVKMKKENNARIEVLAEGVHSLSQFMEVLKVGADVVALPLSVIKEWSFEKMRLPSSDDSYDQSQLSKIPYVDLSLKKDPLDYDILHHLTAVKLEEMSDALDTLL
jgi:transaldolase